jgi:hypothetical protein
MADLDRVCPPYVESELITLRLRDALAVPRVSGLVDLAVDYSGAAPYGGVVLPLGLIITGPTVASEQRREFRRFLPTSIVWTPTAAGRYTVSIHERYHNRLRGSLIVNVLTQS